MSARGNFGFIAQDKRFTNLVVPDILAARVVRTQLLESTTGSFDQIAVAGGFSTPNVELDTITKDGTTLAWPVADGAAGEVLTTDGNGNLGFTAAGTGNVSTAASFAQDNRLTRTDTSSGPDYIQTSVAQLDDLGNLTATSFVGPLVGNATSATTAVGFSGALAGDVSGPQATTVVDFVGGKTASQVATATTTVQGATPSPMPSSLVQRDAMGNFSANTVTANLVGNASTATSTSSFSGALLGDVTGVQAATVVATVGGQSASTVAAGAVLANAATSTNIPSTIVKRDGLGNFSAGTVTATLSGTATNFSGSLSGDVGGTQPATVVNAVGGQSAANVATGTSLANAATSANTFGALVKRDGAGNFAAGTVTASLAGNATSATSFTGSLLGDVTGTQPATVVSTVGGQSAANVAAGTTLANAATSANTASALVRRDASGNFVAGTITATLSGAATTATSFTGSLSGDVTGTQAATTVALVGGLGASSVAAGSALANASTALATAGSIVRRDGSGNFSANAITAPSFLGNATTATSFLGSLTGDVTGTQAATVVSTVGGTSAANVALGANAANAATSANTASTIVKRDASGNFSAGTVTASLAGNATTATTATSAGSFSGALVGDVTGTQGATVVATVGGQSAANVASATTTTLAATNTNTPLTLVMRDGAGNFSAGTVSANLTGNVTGNLAGNATTSTTATTATSFTGPLLGDVTGNQGTTQVVLVGGQTAAAVASGAVLANSATHLNTASALVRRDALGHFAATTVTSDLIGNVTGNLSGNASTATLATSATTATSFSGPLVGDVTGTQGATVVGTVGGVSAANVALGANAANAASSANMFGTIAKRDGAGKFAATLITVSDPPVAPTDVTNKQYVDSAVSSGIVPKDPANALADANVALLSGPQTIDAVPLVAGNVVLLTAQTNPIENGLWTVQALAWTRPADFATGSLAGTAFVVILSGPTYGGTSWICSTPLAVVDTDPISFVPFNLPSSIVGANVGTGAGQVYRDKTGVTLNFKTLSNAAPGVLVANPNGHVLLDNLTDEVNLATDATPSNVASSIVSRDASGNFAAGTITASLTGAASLNVLKTGDTMTGDLNVTGQQAVVFSSPANANTVSLRAPAVIAASSVLNLPSNAPVAGQFLRAINTTDMAWSTVGGASAVTRQIIVSKAGSDLLGNGTIVAPYLTVTKGVQAAVALAPTVTDPVLVIVGPGIYVEDNSGGPITVSVGGISIVAQSLVATNVLPTDNSQDLFLIQDANFEMTNLVLIASGPSTASGLVLSAGSGTAVFSNVFALGFQTGFSFTNPTPLLGYPIILVSGMVCSDNAFGLVVTDAFVILQTSLFGTQTQLPTANTGLTATGTSCLILMSGSSFQLLGEAVINSNGAQVRTNGCFFIGCTSGIRGELGSKCTATACTFLQNGTAASASGAGTFLEIGASTVDGLDPTTLLPSGTGFAVSTAADLDVDSCSIDNCTLGISVGQLGDTASTKMDLSASTFSSCTLDMQQLGTATLLFYSGSFDPAKTSIADPTNVDIAAINQVSGSLSIGSLANEPSHGIYEILNSTTTSTLPTLIYHADYYGYQGTTYANPAAATPTVSGVQSLDDTSKIVVTGNRTKSAALALLSDTAGFATWNLAADVRGWFLNKSGTGNNNLLFEYQNTDVSGQALRSRSSVAELDGLDNVLSFPLTTSSPAPTNSTAKLVWAGDTNLYRVAASTLQTDGTFRVGSLTANRAVVSDASLGLASSATTASELAFLAGTTSSVQTQLNSKLPLAGGTLTGALTLPAGTTALPSLLFTGSSTGTGLSAATADVLSLSTSGAERIRVAAGGAIQLSSLAGTAGVVHSSAAGDLSSSLVVGADIAANTIPDSKLQTLATAGKVDNTATTATSANTANAIVARDASGNFSANAITAATFSGNATTATSFTGPLVGDVTGTQGATVVSAVGGQTAASVASATTLANAATSAATPNQLVLRNASGNFSAGTITAALSGNATTATTATNFSGSLVGDVTGTQAATVVSSVGGVTAANVATGANLANAATNLNTVSTIVKRDASGNFSAGTITAALSGNATTATTSTSFSGSLVGDVTGTQGATVVSAVGGVTASNVALGANAANAATNANTASTIVKRDASGNFSAGTITAALLGNATTSTTSTNFSGSLAGDVTGTQSTTVVSAVGGVSAANVALGANAANAATNLNTVSTIVKRDASGNFAAGTITASLSGNATTATSATTATNFSGSLVGDVTGTQGATVVSTVGGVSAANVALGANAANAATNLNTVSTIVKRDASGNFVAGTITASLSGNATTATSATTATTATTATNFSGSLVGDVTGTQGATVVSTVGGVSAANVALGTNAANAATDVNTPSTIVERNASGNFAAGLVSVNSLAVLGGGSIAIQDGQMVPNSVGLQTPATVTANYTLTLPPAVGSTGQVLSATNGTGALGWASALTNPMTTTGDMIYSTAGSTPTRLPVGASAGYQLATLSGIPTWSTTAQRTASRSSFYDEFMGLPTTNFAVAVVSGGTATANSPTALDNSIGCARLTVAVTSGSRVSLSMVPNVSFGFGVITCSFRVQLSALAVAVTNAYVLRVGWGNNTGAGAHTSGAWFQYDSTNANWQYYAAGTGSSSSASAVPPVANTWQVLQIVVNAAGNSQSYYINGALVGSLIITMNARAGLNMKLENPIATLGNSAFFDWVTQESTTTAARGTVFLV